MKLEKPLSEYLKLYLILESSLLRLPLDEFISQCLDGGVTAIQVRDRGFQAAERFGTAKTVASLIKDRDVLLIVNNTIDIAISVGAHGVHLGIEDLPPDVVRRTFPGLIVGYSCNNNTDCENATAADAHYAGIGPAFFTGTKSNLRPVIGVGGIKELSAKLSIPKVAIGGVNLSNVMDLAACGVDGIAVSSALCASEKPYEVALELRKIFDRQ